ncbi:MAG: tRNA lysidine(34) synthetase TilS [Cyclobacteriaceae bacterium]
MVEQLLNHINRYALGKTTDKILVAVSGGLDSMVLLHLLRAAGFKVGVVHCNFQLRGEDSEADADLVQLTCAELHIPYFIRRFDTKDHATAQGTSIQMAARDLRYTFFQELLKTEPFEYLATAHHFNDSIETILLNLVRGTGIDGLAGIAPKKEKIIRPLLFATRQMIQDYALTHRITWREDSSNLTDDYQRNFLRHQVIPKFLEMNPGFEESFRDTQERLFGAALFKRAHVKEISSAAVETRNNKTIVEIRKILGSQSPAVLLWELIKDLGFNYDQCRQIVGDHQPGKKFFSDSHQLLADRTQYFIERKQLSDFLTQTIEKGQQSVGDAPFVLTTREILYTDFQMLRDSSLAQLDADQLKFPLVWRKWQAGDYFIPLGMRQEKKLSDFLIDLKIPFNTKADVTVLESGGDIVWVVGYRISERYKVTPDTKRILVIEEKQTPR